jgi:hypothetical protein
MFGYFALLVDFISVNFPVNLAFYIVSGIFWLYFDIFSPKKEFSGEKAYKINLSVGNKLGEGQFGEVYKIKQRESGMLCAAKLFKVPY